MYVSISISIYLFEEEYKCAQVHKHKAAHEIKIKMKIEEECKRVQVHRHKAAHENKNNENNQKRSVRKSINTKLHMNKCMYQYQYQYIYLKRSTSVRKSVNTKPRMK
jgi:hypothetical protein